MRFSSFSLVAVVFISVSVLYQLRMVRRHAHAGKASHGKAGKVAGSRIERANQQGCVVGQGGHVISTAYVFRLALRAMVIGNHAVLLFEDGALRLKHGMVHQQAVREDDGLRAAAGLFVKEVDAVDVDGGHFLNPDPELAEGEGTLL